MKELFQTAINAVHSLKNVPYEAIGNDFTCIQDGKNGNQGTSGSSGYSPLGILTNDGDPGQNRQRGEDGTDGGNITVCLVPLQNANCFMAVQLTAPTAVMQTHTYVKMKFSAHGGNGGDGGDG